MTLITCIGEALIDFLPVEEAGRTVGFRIHPGGCPFNVAVAASRLGVRSALATRVSTDFFGRRLRAHLEAEGVDTRWLNASAGPSTLAFVAVESGEPVFSFYGEGAADTRLTGADLPDALLEESAVVHVGSISLLRGTTPAAVFAACERAAGHALISLDPNVRPGLVTDEPAYRALLARLTALADVVKVSAADLAWLAPADAPEAAAAGLVAAGAGVVVLTRGGRGAVAFRAGDGGCETIEGSGFDVPVVDTVGAGDAFQAGLLSWLVERGATSRAALAALPADALRAGLRFAAAVAALNCTRAGADPPDRSAVDAFLAARESGAAEREGESHDGRR